MGDGSVNDGRGAPCSAGVEEILAALAVPGVGPVMVRRLFARFGSWEAVRTAGRGALSEVAGMSRATARAISEHGTAYDPTEEMEKARQMGIGLVPFTSDAYPAGLRDHDGTPPLLYVRGELLERDAVAVGVVGSRRASLYGRRHAERLAFSLAQAGFTVVSGLAQGIDTAAHEGALKAQGRTIAVLGNGLSSIYPPENKELADRVAKSGAVVSELPLDAPPVAANFPPRNRIIAGLSLGVVVVEASRKSGALITARLAGEMGKEVFAVPGDIGRPQARGAHQLIRDGAKLVESVDDIIEELGPLARPVRVREGEAPLPDPRALSLNHHERLVYDLLDGTPKDIDAITRETRLSAANVSSTLMVLELKRLAAQMPGMRYVRAGSLQREV